MYLLTYLLICTFVLGCMRERIESEARLFFSEQEDSLEEVEVGGDGER